LACDHLARHHPLPRHVHPSGTSRERESQSRQ
jgi:hypothetical protein